MFGTLKKPIQRNVSVGAVANRKVAPVAAPARRISVETVKGLEAELASGEAMKALRRYNDAVEKLDAQGWEPKMKNVFRELSHNLETFNPAFTAVMLKVQMTVGATDYRQRDHALQQLIQPLAGEYGVVIGAPLLKTHRQLFAEWYESVMGEPLEAVMQDGIAPAHSHAFFARMMNDILTGGGHADPVAQASYAMGYNLAIEFLADFEKTWALDSFRKFDARVLCKDGQASQVDYMFLKVHAEHECEHAAIGHAAVVALVPEAHEPLLRKAMRDHDAEMAAFYNALADMLV